MSDPAPDLTAAIAATTQSARAFARALGVDERTVRRWQAGERALPETIRRLCVVTAARPVVLDWLAEHD